MSTYSDLPSITLWLVLLILCRDRGASDYDAKSGRAPLAPRIENDSREQNNLQRSLHLNVCSPESLVSEEVPLADKYVEKAVFIVDVPCIEKAIRADLVINSYVVLLRRVF